VYYPAQPPAALPARSWGPDYGAPPPIEEKKSPAVAGLLSGLFTGVPMAVGFGMIA